MKKPKRSQETKPVIAQKAATNWWWPWAAALAGLFVVFEAYGPALNGAYVLDDRFLPFDAPQISDNLVSGWVGSLRPLLMFSWWINHRLWGPIHILITSPMY